VFSFACAQSFESAHHKGLGLVHIHALLDRFGKMFSIAGYLSRYPRGSH